MTRRPLTHNVAQADQQRGDRDNPEVACRKPKPPHLQRGHRWVDKANGNSRANSSDSGPNCADSQESQHSLHVIQLEVAAEPALKQPRRKECLSCVDGAEGESELLPVPRTLGLGVMMGPEVADGTTQFQTGVQARGGAVGAR